MKSPSQILSEQKIEARHSGEGQQSTKCPVCSHTRKKKNVKCMSLTIDHKGVRWYCHHCQQSGGEFYDQSGEYQPRPNRRKLTLNDLNHQRRISQ